MPGDFFSGTVLGGNPVGDAIMMYDIKPLALPFRLSTVKKRQVRKTMEKKCLKQGTER